ncbi:MAG: GNAT family N-acetyltransferase [Muribaculaceae bacterium]|nr:GNAT family N-acetyltransferase [Muribaculaceae bacterium]
MIVKSTLADSERIKRYIGKNYAACLYLYMDLIQYGPESDFTKTWIQEETGEILCILLSYHTAMHIYAQNSFNVQEVVNLIKELRPSQICATKTTILALKDSLSIFGYEIELGYVGKLEYSSQIKYDCIQEATIDDVDDISTLLFHDEGIGASYTLEDLKIQFRERLSQGFVRSYIIKDNGKIVAHLGTGAEVGNVCIITYVITDQEYRGHGYAKMLYQAACHDLHQEGKDIYAVYYTDNAIHLHHSVGFKDCCEFGKLFLKTH